MNVRALTRSAGFTLIEVLVALVIVAFGIGALMATLTSAADSVVVIRDKTFAEWIALNRVSELRLRPPPLTAGKTTGDVEFANQQWQWSATIQDTGQADLTRIDVEVGRKPEGNGRFQVIATGSGFVDKATGTRTGATPDWSNLENRASGQRRRQEQSQAAPGTTGAGATPPAVPVAPPINNPGSRE